MCYTPCLRSMLFALSSWVSLFGFVSYYLVMILRSSTDRGHSKAFAHLCPAPATVHSALAHQPVAPAIGVGPAKYPTRHTNSLPWQLGWPNLKQPRLGKLGKGSLKYVYTTLGPTTSLPRQLSWPSSDKALRFSTLDVMRDATAMRCGARHVKQAFV